MPPNLLATAPTYLRTELKELSQLVRYRHCSITNSCFLSYDTIVAKYKAGVWSIIGYVGKYKQSISDTTSRHIYLFERYLKQNSIPYRWVNHLGQDLTNALNSWYIFKHEEPLEDNCSICCEKGNKKTVKTSCGHIFHKKCLNKWLEEKQECPLCRTKFPTYQFVNTNQIQEEDVDLENPMVIQQDEENDGAEPNNLELVEILIEQGELPQPHYSTGFFESIEYDSDGNIVVVMLDTNQDPFELIVEVHNGEITNAQGNIITFTNGSNYEVPENIDFDIDDINDWYSTRYCEEGVFEDYYLELLTLITPSAPSINDDIPREEIELALPKCREAFKNDLKNEIAKRKELKNYKYLHWYSMKYEVIPSFKHELEYRKILKIEKRQHKNWFRDFLKPYIDMFWINSNDKYAKHIEKMVSLPKKVKKLRPKLNEDFKEFVYNNQYNEDYSFPCMDKVLEVDTNGVVYPTYIMS